MKRRDFLKKIGWVVPVVVTAPIIASELIKEDTVNVFDIDKIKERQEFLKQYPLTEDECFNIPGTLIGDTKEEIEEFDYMINKNKGILAQMEKRGKNFVVYGDVNAHKQLEKALNELSFK